MQLDLPRVISEIEKSELILLLRGEEPYRIEYSQYVPSGEITDVGKVLSKIIHKSYNIRPNIKEKFEEALLDMLNQTDFDVYMVVLYIISQLFKEKNGLSPFSINLTVILSRTKKELEKRKERLKQGIVYPNGFTNKNAWNDICRINRVAQEEYNVKLF